MTSTTAFVPKVFTNGPYPFFFQKNEKRFAKTIFKRYFKPCLHKYTWI